jgi:hypothetical protein
LLKIGKLGKRIRYYQSIHYSKHSIHILIYLIVVFDKFNDVSKTLLKTANDTPFNALTKPFVSYVCFVCLLFYSKNNIDLFLHYFTSQLTNCWIILQSQKHQRQSDIFLNCWYLSTTSDTFNRASSLWEISALCLCLGVRPWYNGRGSAEATETQKQISMSR